jgi:hypothetical protein
MTSLETDVITISTVLNRLENLDTDTYIIAFGPNDKQFIATPNGYAAYISSLPRIFTTPLTALQHSPTRKGPRQSCWNRCQESHLGFDRRSPRVLVLLFSADKRFCCYTSWRGRSRPPTRVHSADQQVGPTLGYPARSIRTRRCFRRMESDRMGVLQHPRSCAQSAL